MDVARHGFALEWMDDLDAYADALEADASYAATLSRQGGLFCGGEGGRGASANALRGGRVLRGYAQQAGGRGWVVWGGADADSGGRGDTTVVPAL